MLHAFASTARKELPAATRGAHLSAIARHLSEGALETAFSELRDYAAIESDAAFLDTIVTKTLKLVADTAPEKLPALLAGFFAQPSHPTAHLRFAQKLFDNARDITGDRSLDGFRTIASHDPALARFAMKSMDEALWSIDDAATAANFAAGMVNWGAAHADKLTLCAVERALDEAKRIPDFTTRVTMIGHIGLDHAIDEDALKDTARQLLLEELAKARDTAAVATILRATSRGGVPDAQIDSAAAEKWQMLTSVLPRAKKFAAALDIVEVLGTPQPSRVTAGKTFRAALGTIVQVAQEYAKESRLPENVALALIGIVREGFDKTGSATALLTQLAAKPKFSLRGLLHI